MPEPVAYLHGKFIPASQAAVPVSDAGFVLGVTVAEQLRTFAGRLFRLEQHLHRLFQSLSIVGVDPGLSHSELARTAEELVARNHPLLSPGDDLGLSMFVTPGPYATMAPSGSGGPLVGMHTYPLPFFAWADKYALGESLVIPRVRQVSPLAWPRELKCRSRMHYYLADRQARAVEPGARALLLDEDGSVTEATTANLVLYRTDEGLISPPQDRILPGISVATLRELTAEMMLPWRERLIHTADVTEAQEVFLTSTSPCVLPVVRLDGRPIGAGCPGQVFQRLLAAWSELVKVDIAAQAVKFSQRSSDPSSR